jgi:hypothetical protein
MAVAASSWCANADVPRRGIGRAGQVCLARSRRAAFRGGSLRCMQDTGRPSLRLHPGRCGQSTGRRSWSPTWHVRRSAVGPASNVCSAVGPCASSHLIYSCSRIAVGIRRRPRRSQTEQGVCLLLLRSAARDCRRSQLYVDSTMTPASDRAGSFVSCAVGHCPVPGRLHGEADSPPSDGNTADLDQV